MKRNDDALLWKELKTEHLVQDEWIDFRRSSYLFPNGEVFEPFYSYSRRNFVVICARDENGNYICVRQFRQGLRRITTEFCAGGIEQKDSVREHTDAALIAAKRELLEETGYTSEHWRHLLTLPANPTMADNYAYLFVADDCICSAEQELDETEFLERLTCTPEELDQLVRDGEFVQGLHLLAKYLADQKTGK